MAMRIANQIHGDTIGQEQVETWLPGMSLTAARKFLRQDGITVPSSRTRFIRQLREIGFTVVRGRIAAI